MTQTTAPGTRTAIVNANVDREIWIDGTDRIPLPRDFQTWETSAVLQEHGWTPVKGAHLQPVGPGQFSITVRRIG